MPGLDKCFMRAFDAVWPNNVEDVRCDLHEDEDGVVTSRLIINYSNGETTDPFEAKWFEEDDGTWRTVMDELKPNTWEWEEGDNRLLEKTPQEYWEIKSNGNGDRFTEAYDYVAAQ